MHAGSIDYFHSGVKNYPRSDGEEIVAIAQMRIHSENVKYSALRSLNSKCLLYGEHLPRNCFRYFMMFIHKLNNFY